MSFTELDEPDKRFAKRVPIHVDKKQQQQQAYRKTSKLNFNYSPNLLKKADRHVLDASSPSSKNSSKTLKQILPIRTGQRADSLSTKSIDNEVANVFLSSHEAAAAGCGCAHLLNGCNLMPQISPASNLNQDAQIPAQSFKLILLKACQSKMKSCLVGLSLCLLTCLSFLLMTYCLRHAFLVHKKDQYQFNSTSLNETTTHGFSDYSCPFCYLIVWSTTCFLTLMYPLYILIYLLNCKCGSKDSKDSRSLNKLVVDSIKSFYVVPNQKNERVESTRLKHDLVLKIAAITVFWILTGYLMLKAVTIVKCSDFIILYSANYSFVYMTSWIVLHVKFIPLRVNASFCLFELCLIYIHLKIFNNLVL